MQLLNVSYCMFNGPYIASDCEIVQCITRHGIWFGRIWLSLLDVALSIAVVNTVLLLTIFLVCHPTKLQKYCLQNVDPGAVMCKY